LFCRSQRQKISYNFTPLSISLITSSIQTRLPPRYPKARIQSHNLPRNPPPVPALPLTNKTKIHGWPDLSIGWRYQIPVLLAAGYRVVCPDIMGFGQTDAPSVPPESIAYYSFKRAAEDINELARQLGAPQIILGGHDWVSGLTTTTTTTRSPPPKRLILTSTGRSHRIPRSPLVPGSRNPHLRSLHPLPRPLQNLPHHRNARRDAVTQLGLPTPARKRDRGAGHPLQSRNQTVPQRALRRAGPERRDRLRCGEGGDV